ncbi:type I-C CRISPR-associated protein Cas7/Csd2 [Paenibacillus peoriae]|uniref:type I-C CRISPR-associated protein Cas7/Csd2 n=1 Tax=Paenibacillus TaxID=44249 RepID=UPI0004915CD7|nr:MULTISPECIES: type I-C CRISPR-associated protein Cas7/Csd2 [Paenibacillus]OMF74890.1 type I-C CRISPR-associated protein Cas7/Csd2 [Paenibacillus peoriae]OMF82036.1 type I-C CRISPR-associated protein Cas7/Csd2 [Paenibacillus peoriae]PPQ50001.1 type I-C CRISPR-associated protein Cas7/Csd2 [Paenibacillus peoriae]SFQ96580.1 CRISPR-associated protein, Csd2 family [Paenibacillus sp. cl130]
MSVLDHKIDFAVVLSVRNANPNGDPLNGNRPRQNYDGYGEISDVCIKRKIRNRLQDTGESILVQSDERRVDAYRSIKERVDANEEVQEFGKGKKQNNELYAQAACKSWIDVRSFGQVFAFTKEDISLGIRGPVSIHTAVSLAPIDISSMQITKSVNAVTPKDPNKKSSDTMGMKHRVDFGVYVFYGSINTQLAEKTGFTYEDAEKIREALRTLFENDTSSARPDGSMEVHHLYWWEHNSKLGKYSSAKVHRSLQIQLNKDVSEARSFEDYVCTVQPLEGLEVQEYAGL